MNNFSVGEIVESTQGRDKGNYYIIYGFAQSKALLVNGASKTISNPKVKNLNHLTKTNTIHEILKQKIVDKKVVFDAEIYSAIKKFKENIKGV